MNETSIIESIKGISLHYLAKNLEDFLTEFPKQTALAEAVIRRLVEREIEYRRVCSLHRRLKESKLTRLKPMDDFDWEWPKKIDKALILELMKLSFIDVRKNVLLIGPQGVGKTTIAKNIAYLATLAGKSTLFTTASEIVLDLTSALNAGTFRSRQRRYLRPSLLIIDEIGYLSFDNKAADLLFDVVSKRYEESSIIVTTNLAFSDWGKIFPGASCVTALIDRFTHHCDIVSIEADSYRLHEAKNPSKKTKTMELKNEKSKQRTKR